MKFREQLQILGFDSYEAYLAGDHWQAFKKQYASEMKPRCAVCKSPKIELHHQSYERLGSERNDDIVPLCAFHHAEVHKMLGRKGVDCTPWAIGVLTKAKVIVIGHPDQRRPYYGGPSGKRRIADVSLYRNRKSKR